NADVVDEMLALFADPITSLNDFDDRLIRTNLGDRTQFDLVSDFAAMDIISCYEDQLYDRGEKYEEFVKEWEELKMRYNKA
ncbi:hypothetical protein ACI4B7_26060, partial [Klebsiella pneumoniae]|uniref:hypothetical protein n=1 Tax=Klebsiella pneumoniae TaxID=573 RepID=UPI003851FCA3